MSRRRRVPDELADFTEPPKKRADRKLGPSDSSDTGADMMGLGGEDDTSDREGTGERASVEDGADSLESADIEPDRVVEANQAGLGGGLDQAEEAQLGVTDEELDELRDGADSP